MFRIESYITPIILSHIDKYVKDFRPKDAQVSLWGGEVAFQNLDLRLDVLEEELQLPFSFVSGHIHELTVRVPWTKIASEPIQITINTIEFVLKLRTADDARTKATAAAAGRKKSRADLIAAAPPGYMASLVNRIANNISLKLHNVILKYVEDDIVVSMNIQLLSFDSANDLWQPDFIDISPTKVLLKKVINITDLTICLDKRNSMGIIEICQEPMLYRCSLQLRLLRRYNIASAHRTSLLRMDIHTDSVELNISAQQYPMLLRLLELANALREGRMQAALAAQLAAAAAQATAASAAAAAAAAEDAEGGGGNGNNLAAGAADESDADPEAGASMISWAWNMLPTLFPAEAYEEENVARKLGHILHTGLYVNHLNVTFKSQELIGDNISNAAKKLKYHPLLRVSLVGMYASTVTIGQRWFNATGGLSSFTAQPLGLCVCGSPHSAPTALLQSADILSTHRGHLDGSLWDIGATDQREEVRSYDRLWESHASKVLMTELQRRTPALAFDAVHEVDIGDEQSASSSLLAASTLEYSNLSESYVMRAAVGEFRVRYNSSVAHIGQRLHEYAGRYEYPPYAAEAAAMTRDALSPPAADDYEALMTDVPMRLLELSVARPIVEVHLGRHEEAAQLPHLVLELEEVRLRATAPYYPNRLVYTTCLLPEPPARLLDACYARYAADCKAATVAMCYGKGLAATCSVHVKCASTEVSSEQLIYPHLWELGEKPRATFAVNAECCTLVGNKPQLMLLNGLGALLGEQAMPWMPQAAPKTAPKEPEEPQLQLHDTSVLADSKDLALPVVEVRVHRIVGSYSRLQRTIGAVASVASLQGLVYVPKAIESVGFIEMHKHKAIFVADDQPQPELLSVVLQAPDSLAETLHLSPRTIPTCCAIQLRSVLFNLDPLLCDFLNYQVRCANAAANAAALSVSGDAKPPSVEVGQSRTTLTSKISSDTEQLPVPIATSLIQIFPLDRVIPIMQPEAVAPGSFRPWYRLARPMAISVECKSCTLFVPERSLRMAQRDSKLRDIVTAGNGGYCATIRLPSVALRSAHDATVLAGLQSVRRLPHMLVAASAGGKADGFTWTVALSGWDGTTTMGARELGFVRVQRTTITVAVSLKSQDGGGSKGKASMEPSFVIHADTAPIELCCSDAQAVFLHHVAQCVRALGNASFSVAGQPGLQPARPPQIEISARPTSPGFQGQDLKEFFGTVHEGTTEGSDRTYSTVQPDAGKGGKEPRRRVSVWLQWTLAKLGCKLYSLRAAKEWKFVLEMEDIIGSFDQQDVYTKLRLKAGTLNGECQQREAAGSGEDGGGVVADQWRKVDEFGLIARNTLSDSMEETFVELTVTQALTKNVHGRWFSKLRKKQNKQLINTISEVMVTLQSIDVKVDLDVLDAFLPVILALGGQPKETNPASVARSPERVVSVRDFPIVYVKSEGVRVFFPLKVAEKSPQCDVFFLKITRISITPSTENPLSRKPIRGDIYSKATELNILNVPGSSVENRQFEITFSSISLSSGRWTQIREHLEPSISTVKNAAKKNPAFDWNNLTIKPSVEIRSIFERFNLTIVYAPCIVFENLLVCGECVELNCVSDLIVNLHSHELLLLQQLGQQIQDISASTSRFNLTKAVRSRMQSTRSSATARKSRYCVAEAISHRSVIPTAGLPTQAAAPTDSGVESMDPASARHRSRSAHSKNIVSSLHSEPYSSYIENITTVGCVPYDISFVGGIFNVKVYHSKPQSSQPTPTTSKPTSPVLDDSQDADIPYAHPLVSFTVFQPNVLISQSVIEKKSQLSLFNLIVRLGPSFADADMTPTTQVDFNDIVFNTLPALPNRHGIPQPLLLIKKHNRANGDIHFDFRVNRPNMLSFSHTTMRKVQELLLVFGVPNSDSPDSSMTMPPQPLTPPVNKFKLIRKNLLNADRIQITLDATTIESSSADADYAVTFGWSRVTGLVELSRRQQRIRTDIVVQAIALHAGHGIVLNPTTVRTIAMLTKELWKKQSLCTLNVHSTCLDICVGPNNVLNVQRMQESFQRCLSPVDQPIPPRPTFDPQQYLSDVELLEIPTPKVSQEDLFDNEDEYYQDDLRAGAFQFIESDNTVKSDAMPLPYQIQITSRDGGVICWRYPQPRALHYVQVFPVLCTLRSRKPIRCELQYYSLVHREFQSFAEFHLSHESIQQLSLPPRPIIAEVWRILVHQPYISVTRQQFQGDEEDEEDSELDEEDDDDDEDFTRANISDLLNAPENQRTTNKQLMGLHPRALVGCIRIDSKFHPQMVPNFEFVLQLDHFLLSLRHDKADMTKGSTTTQPPQLPAPVRQYFLGEAATRELQTLIKLSQRGVRFYCGIYDDMKWTVTAETKVSLSVLDMGYLTMQPLLDECHLKADISNVTNKEAGLDIQTVVDLVRLRYGQCIGYTLSLASELWQKEFANITPAASSSAQPRSQEILAHRYIIANCTSTPMKLGQVSTEEALFLRSNECLPYAFRSVCSPQKLRVSRETQSWSFEQPIDIGTTENTQTLRMLPTSGADGTVDGTATAGQLLLVQTQRSGAGSQIVVTLRGMVEFRNMTGQEFRVQYRVSELAESTSEKSGGSVTGAELDLAANASMSLVTRCDESMNQSIKLRLSNGDKKGWSGEIPLHRTPKNTPWLVKVPTYTEQQFITFWVRVLREDVVSSDELLLANMPAKPQRMLIVIWPLFMVRSMLPVPVTAYDLATDTMYQLLGRGHQPVELSIPGTHETEHDITFDTNSYFNTTTKLSYKTIDRNLFYADLDKAMSIDDISQRLSQPTPVQWPCSQREEEQRWFRNVSQLQPMQLQFNRLPSQPLSSCLMLDVLATCLFINSVGNTVQVLNADGTATMVQSNNVAMPATVTTQFKLSIMLNNRWHTTCPIYMAAHPTQRSCRQQPNFELADETSTSLKLLAPHTLCKYQLSSSISNGVRVLIISPHFVLANYTALPLEVWAFCVLQRQRTELKLPAEREMIGSHLAPPQPPNSGGAHRGIGLSEFYNLSHDPDDTNFNKLFNYFVAIRSASGEEFSVPVPLNKAVARNCFSIPVRPAAGEPATSMPLALSIIEHLGQTFVSVYEDQAPCMRIINQTAQRLFVAQAESADPAAQSPAAPMPTLNDDQFEWFTTVAGGQTVFFTPPSWDAAFPEQESAECALMLAACSASSDAVTNTSAEQIAWCRPFAAFRPMETFLELPDVGDVRVTVVCKRRTVDVIIGQIDHNMEFNVKDIRTKLLHPVEAGRKPETAAKQPVSAAAVPPVCPPATGNGTGTSTSTSLPIAFIGFVQGLHLTLFTDQPHRHCRKSELMAIYLDQIAVRYASARRQCEAHVHNMQIDNQLHCDGSYDFPVVLCMQPQSASSGAPSPLPASPPPSAHAWSADQLPAPHQIAAHCARLQATEGGAALSLTIILCPDLRGAAVPDELLVRLRPLSAYIEDKYINVLLDFLLENVPGSFALDVSASEVADSRRQFCEPGQVLMPLAVHRQAADWAQPFRMRRIRIEPLSVLLSVHTCQRMYIALDHSPLDFAAYERHNVCSLPARIGWTLGRHYVSGALFGAGWVVGSLEMLGAPSGLARSVTTGLRDFVTMPVEGILRGPWGLLVGITHGSASLIRNVTAGTVNSVTKLAASVARNLDRLTLDAEHLQRTEALRRHRPASIAQGISQGLTGLGISLLGAVGGLSRHPLEAQSSLAVVAGIGRGLVGAVTKPISGAAELVALTGQGVLQTVGFNAMPSAREMAAGGGTATAEPAAAKFTGKYVPSAYGGDQVLFVAAGTMQCGAVAVALCTHLLVLVEVDGDRVLEVFALERIAVRLDEQDDTLVRIGVGGQVDSLVEEQEFQYSRVVQFVNDTSELVLRPVSVDKTALPAAAASGACEDLRPVAVSQMKQQLQQPGRESLSSGRGAVSSSGRHPADVGAKGTSPVMPVPMQFQAQGASSAAAPEATANAMLYMDAHLARHLVQYVHLLQRIFKTKSKAMTGE